MRHFDNRVKESLDTAYVITGVLANGKRFAPIHTNTPQHYNIYRGTVWLKTTYGRRVKLWTIWN